MFDATRETWYFSKVIDIISRLYNVHPVPSIAPHTSTNVFMAARAAAVACATRAGATWEHVSELLLGARRRRKNELPSRKKNLKKLPSIRMISLVARSRRVCQVDEFVHTF
jgi:hypothetical protein